MTDNPVPISRRAALGGFAGAGLLLPRAAGAQTALRTRPILHGGEALPVVGVGTAGVFDVSPNERGGPTAVVRALLAGGGTVIDTAGSYGESENVIGAILAETGLGPKSFVATKLEEYRPGGEKAEAEGSLARLRLKRVDLLMLHNVTDPNQEMGGLNALKAEGLCRYTGITTTYKNAYDAAEAITRRARPDFLEIDYALDNRSAESRLLPAAMAAGTGVLVALPLGRGRLFRKALGKPLPEWAAEFDCGSWAQFFLKWLIGHPAVTAVIPGTANPAHMRDNLGAGHGRLPDAKMRARMVQYIESL
jgi:aryl-alcohol dehydrogenase-like predicted oxidoreductase